MSFSARFPKPVILVGILVGAVWLVAMTGSAPAADALVVRTWDRVRVLDPESGDVAATSIGGRISPDGQAVVGARLGPDSTTQVEAVRVADGTVLWSRQLPRHLAVRLVSPQGARVVLAPGYTGDRVGTPISYIAGPRLRTKIVVASAQRSRTYRLDGNYEPEALSTDGTSLFVIKFTPPRNPKLYQVRRLDLTTGTVHEVYTPDAELQESMGGKARTQAAASDGKRLYTLYSARAATGGNDIFVHVLSLDELWAHCIHLPHGFSGNPGQTALAVSPDNSRLYVADSVVGRIAEINTESLEVVRDVPADVPSGHGRTITATVTGDGGLVVAGGRTVRRFDISTVQTMGVRGPTPATPTLDTVMTYTAARAVTAVSAATGGGVYVALSKRILLVDSANGSTLHALKIGGRQPIAGMGITPEALADPRQAMNCAC